MTKVAVKTVHGAEDFEFEYEDDINTSAKVMRLMRQQLDSSDLALIEEMTVTFGDGLHYTAKDPFLYAHEPDGMEKLVAVLSELGIPYDADYADEFVTIEADASDKYVTVVFKNGKFSFSN